jgi:P27 family predicted phage terminase small subunit
MRPGPPPKPTALKKLTGNPGKRPLNKREPVTATPSRMPPAPEHLDATAAEVWRVLGKQLLAADLFQIVDRYAFGMFCVVAGRWIDAEKKLKISGPVLVAKESGNLYQNPYLSVANRAWEQMLKMLGQFGLTPAERSRLVGVAVDEGPTSLADELWSLVQTGEKRK